MPIIKHPWTAEEKQLIRDTLGIPPRELLERFPNHNYRGIIDCRQHIRRQMGLTKPIVKDKQMKRNSGELWQILGGWNYDSLPNISD